MTENVLELSYKFPKNILLEEYDKIKNNKTEIQEPGSKRFSGFWLIWNTDITKKIAKEFVEYYKIPYRYIVNFLYIEPNGVLPWHADQEGSVSAINCILTSDPVPIHFKSGQYVYDTALVDVSSLHQVINNNRERIIFRITFQDSDATFDAVSRLISEKDLAHD